MATESYISQLAGMSVRASAGDWSFTGTFAGKLPLPYAAYIIRGKNRRGEVEVVVNARLVTLDWLGSPGVDFPSIEPPKDIFAYLAQLKEVPEFEAVVGGRVEDSVSLVTHEEESVGGLFTTTERLLGLVLRRLRPAEPRRSILIVPWELVTAVIVELTPEKSAPAEMEVQWGGDAGDWSEDDDGAAAVPARVRPSGGSGGAKRALEQPVEVLR